MRCTHSADTDSLFKQPIHASAIARFFAAPGRPVFFLPLRMRGDGAPGGAAVVGSISASPCGDAEAPPGAPPEHLQCPGSFAVVFFRFAHSRKRNCCAGPRFPCRVLIRVSRSRLPVAHRDRRHFWWPRRQKLRQASAVRIVSQLLAGGSYWPPGGAPAPPECLGGAFVSRPRAPHPAPSSDAS